MSSKARKTEFDSQSPRRRSQTFSTGLRSGARGRPDRREVGRKDEIGRGAPAGAIKDQRGARADGYAGGDFVEMELRPSVSAKGRASAAPVPRMGQTAPNR